MKVGLLAYHSACNMGATLQLLSSYGYWQKNGHTPIVINWVAKDLEDSYAAHTPIEQREAHMSMRKAIWEETNLCRTAEDVAQIIEKENIEAVVIGSDAIMQNHPRITRWELDSLRLIRMLRLTHDRIFPNPFWGIFNDFLEKPIPTAILSASSQDSAYHLFTLKTRIEMAKRLEAFCYISVRDTWTQKMINSITHGKITPPVTPDPVFAFNNNTGDLIESKDEILKRYNLPEKYILLSFRHRFTVSQEWLDEFATLADNYGYICVMLPFGDKPTFGKLTHTIDLPLTPLEWYALIKYSSGYIGHNMHPIIVSIHNNVPFFSFDNYGQRHLNGLLPNDSSSKIRHILNLGGLEEYRISCLAHYFNAPKPSFVLEKIFSFDKDKEQAFATANYDNYIKMMSDIQTAIQHA